MLSLQQVVKVLSPPQLIQTLNLLQKPPSWFYTTKSVTPTTVESISVAVSSAAQSSIAAISSYEGTGNNMKLSFGVVIAGVAAFAI